MIFITFFSSFTTSDWFELLGIIASLFTSGIAIFISIKTLEQNNQMIEESTRPYIVVYTKTTNFDSPTLYLVVKNFGTSGATITKFSCNHDLSQFSLINGITPFSNICGTFIAPGQSFITAIDNKSVLKKNIVLNFEIEYRTALKTYRENINISIDAYKGLLKPRAATKDKELKIISYTLQDFVEKQL